MSAPHSDTRPAPAGPPTLADWRSPAHIRHSVRHIGQVLPLAIVAHDPARRRAWATPLPGDDAPPPDVPAAPATLRWADYLQRTRADGVVVLHQGRLRHVWAADDRPAPAPQLLMSATKSVVGLLCGALAEAGVLDPQAPVGLYLPELAHTGYGAVRVQHLLDMRARPGLSAADVAGYAGATGWEPPVAGPSTTAIATDLHAFFSGLPAGQAQPPGAFAYRSMHTDLLGWVIARAAGVPVPEVLSRRLWCPLGAQADAALTLDPAGAPRTTGGLVACVEDLARVGWALIEPPAALDGIGRWLRDTFDGGRAPDDDGATLARAWSDGDFARAFGRPMHYRNGWYVVRPPRPWLFAMGTHGQQLCVDPSLGLVMAQVGSQPEQQDPRAIGLTMRAFEAWRRRLAG
ncbi:serine hydrolase domain-containing protein [Pseudaquabacterium rugosum]|uniref:Serine hydrolase domain-containing protein n=1 Tax=Pseudaquabacterium rugosum TaxID=2984194 RepID=A0ABU9BG38_9BURK